MAIESIKSFDTIGLTAGPISFSPESHGGQDAAVFLKFDGEKSTPITGSYRSLWKWESKK
jgi:hypothetical protein